MKLTRTLNLGQLVEKTVFDKSSILSIWNQVTATIPIDNLTFPPTDTPVKVEF